MPSIRSAAELKAATMAACVACVRSDAGAAGVLQGGVIRLQPLQLLAGFGQFVGDHQRRHDGQPRIADLAELAAQRDDALVEILGELLQMVLLAVLAGHAELAAVDGDIHLRHGISSSVCDSSTRRMFSIAASSRRAISRFADSRLRTLPSCASRSAASLERSASSAWTCSARMRPAAVDFDPALDRGVEHIQRLGQAPGRGLDRGLIGHRLNLCCVAIHGTDAMKNVESASN